MKNASNVSFFYVLMQICTPYLELYWADSFVSQVFDNKKMKLNEILDEEEDDLQGNFLFDDTVSEDSQRNVSRKTASSINSEPIFFL